MTSARIASIAAIAAFASLGAQAGQLNGNLYGTDFEAGFNASRTRAEVQAEAVVAVPAFKNYYVAPQAAQVAPQLSRAEVREAGRIAGRSQQIATGNFS